MLSAREPAASPATGAIPGRVGTVTVLTGAAAFALLVIGWSATAGLGASELVRGEQLALTTLWILVPLSLAMAAFGSRQTIRIALGAATLVFAAVPVVAGPRTVLAYVPLAFGVFVGASLALPIRVSSMLLFLVAGLVCLVPLGYYILPVPVSVLSLVCAGQLMTAMRAGRPPSPS